MGNAKSWKIITMNPLSINTFAHPNTTPHFFYRRVIYIDKKIHSPTTLAGRFALVTESWDMHRRDGDNFGAISNLRTSSSSWTCAPSPPQLVECIQSDDLTSTVKIKGTIKGVMEWNIGGTCL